MMLYECFMCLQNTEPEEWEMRKGEKQQTNNGRMKDTYMVR